MKKAIALVSAAVLIFTVAGCANKQQPQPQQNETSANNGISSSAQESTVEESVAEPSSTARATEKGEKPTRRPTITTYAARATSPDHLTQRPTTTQRTTIRINVPTREPTTRRPVVTKTTLPRTTALDFDIITSTTQAVPEPQFDYGGVLSFTGADGLTDSVRIVSHECSFTDRRTFAIVLTVETVEHISDRKTINIAYNCYDKDGNKVNEKTLYTIVPLGQPGDTVRTVATATEDTVRVEFINY